jgi:hypothetical protein
MDPEFIVEFCIYRSEVCYSVLNRQGRVVGVFGVEADPVEAGLGSPWAFGSDELTQNVTAFQRLSRLWAGRLRDSYRKLWNYIDARNEVNVRWLERLGFQIVGEAPRYGVEGRRFLRFEWVCPKVSPGGANDRENTNEHAEIGEHAVLSV